MLLGDIIIALILGTISAVIFWSMVRPRHRLPGIAPLFILFFLIAWAGGLWLRPAGPPIFGQYWAPGLILVVLIFLLLAALVQEPPRTKKEVREELAAQEAATTALGVIFWFLIGGLVVAILFGYLI